MLRRVNRITELYRKAARRTPAARAAREDAAGAADHDRRGARGARRNRDPFAEMQLCSPSAPSIWMIRKCRSLSPEYFKRAAEINRLFNERIPTSVLPPDDRSHDAELKAWLDSPVQQPFTTRLQLAEALSRNALETKITLLINDDLRRRLAGDCRRGRRGQERALSVRAVGQGSTVDGSRADLRRARQRRAGHLLHGWPDSWFTYSAGSCHLPAAGSPCLHAGSTGFGDSSASAHGYAIADFLAADVLAFMDAMSLTRAPPSSGTRSAALSRVPWQSPTPERVDRLILIGTGIRKGMR